MKKAVFGLTLVLMGFLVAPVFAADAASKPRFVKDVHYFELIEPQPVQTGDKIEVLEMFWYGCPHCYHIEPLIEKWLKTKPENAAFVRLPAAWSQPAWRFHARVYYTFEALGVLDKLHREFFEVIHKRKNSILKLEQLVPFAARHGIDQQKLLDAYDSFAVDSKVRNSIAVSEKSGANGVPTFIIDGRYRATPTSAGGYAQVFQLINELVEKAASERKK